jgi:hypothetical protein
MRHVVCLLIALALPAGTASAAQVIPTAIEYTNDTIEQGGQLQACVVTAAILTVPAPEIVNFQFLLVANHPGFKVTAGDMDRTKQSLTAKRISDANFSTATFNHPTAFTKDVTPEGQLVAVLTDESLQQQFVDGFFGGGYSIEFKRTDVTTVRTYYIEHGPPGDVVRTFAACVHTMTGN